MEIFTDLFASRRAAYDVHALINPSWLIGGFVASANPVFERQLTSTKSPASTTFCLLEFHKFAKSSMHKVKSDRLPEGRAQLVKVITAAGDVIRITDVTKALSVSRIDAAKRLARWREQGWLSRVGHGAYVSASIDTLGSDLVLDDAWVLIPPLFAPAYIGGRTAAEHWDLTEQIFKDIVVLTGRALRQKRQERHGYLFALKHLDPGRIFGTKSIWRHNTKVQVSDVHRTIIDMLDDPNIGGGIQHVSDCLEAYLERADRDDKILIEYGDRLENKAVFKRLGFLLERNEKKSDLAEACLERLSKGNAKLDPTQSCPRLISKWRLFVPEMWARS